MTPIFRSGEGREDEVEEAEKQLSEMQSLPVAEAAQCVHDAAHTRCERRDWTEPAVSEPVMNDDCSFAETRCVAVRDAFSQNGKG